MNREDERKEELDFLAGQRVALFGPKAVPFFLLSRSRVQIPRKKEVEK